MGSDRLRRVDEAIRQVIGDALAGDLKDPRVGFVTVTDVRTSPDLSHAHVHVSVLGDERQREASMQGLRSAHGFLQRRIAAELRLKRTPTLDFHYDATTDKAMRVQRLLSEAPEARSGRAPEAASGGALQEAADGQELHGTGDERE